MGARRESSSRAQKGAAALQGHADRCSGCAAVETRKLIAGLKGSGKCNVSSQMKPGSRCWAQLAVARQQPASHNAPAGGRGGRYRRRAREEDTTLTLLSAIASAATQGGMSVCVSGHSAPAAMGIARALYLCGVIRWCLIVSCVCAAGWGEPAATAGRLPCHTNTRVPTPTQKPCMHTVHVAHAATRSTHP